MADALAAKVEVKVRLGEGRSPQLEKALDENVLQHVRELESALQDEQRKEQASREIEEEIEEACATATDAEVQAGIADKASVAHMFAKGSALSLKGKFANRILAGGGMTYQNMLDPDNSEGDFEDGEDEFGDGSEEDAEEKANDAEDEKAISNL